MRYYSYKTELKNAVIIAIWTHTNPLKAAEELQNKYFIKMATAHQKELNETTVEIKQTIKRSGRK